MDESLVFAYILHISDTHAHTQTHTYLNLADGLSFLHHFLSLYKFAMEPSFAAPSQSGTCDIPPWQQGRRQ